MTINNGDKPASPLRGADGTLFRLDDGYLEQCGHTLATGLSKREHFAAMAMQGILSSQYIGDFIKGRHDDVDVAAAEASVVHADALLKALEQQK